MRKCGILLKILLLLSVVAIPASFSFENFPARVPAAAQNDDLVRSVQDGLVGALNYLEAAQTDCSKDLKPGEFVCNKEQNANLRLNGGWDSFIEPAFKLMNIKIKSPVAFLDSNMFTTAAVLYPLWFLDTTQTGKFNLSHSINLAMKNIRYHRRGDGYSFWANLGPGDGTVDRIGPVNLYSFLLGSQVEVARRIQNATGLSFMPRDVKWIAGAFGDTNKKLKMDVLFDVPSDADDTSLGIISNYFYFQDRMLERPSAQAAKSMKTTMSLGKVLNHYRDTYESRKHDRSNDDPREKWRHDAYREKNGYSGAYLTWFYDESNDLYAKPEEGVVLTGQNSVDCIVVANSLLAMSASGLKNNPEYRQGYEDSCNAITNVILNRNDKLRYGNSGRTDAKDEPAWRYCGLFYPAHLTFPYKISRAVRDGGACKDLKPRDQERFNKAMGTLMKNVLEERKDGIWTESIDDTKDLPTALALTSLLNLGQELGRYGGVKAAELSEAIDTGMRALQKMKKVGRERNGLPVYSLGAGIFFGGGTLNEIALWKSAPFATGVFLEASIKYLQQADKASHLKNSGPERQKLVLGDLNKQDGKVVFVMDNRSMDDLLAKSRVAAYESVLAEPATAPESDEISATVPDRLGRVLPSHVAAQTDIAFEKGDQGEFGIVALQLDVGHLYQKGQTQVAYYLVRIRNQVGLSSDGSKKPTWRMDAAFMGIAADSPEVKDDVGFLPITIIKEQNMLDFEAHVLKAGAELPLWSSANGFRLDLSLAGKLLGYAYKRLFNELDTAPAGHALSIGELDLGLMLRYKDLASIQAGGEAGVQLISKGVAGSRLVNASAPFRVGARFTMKMTKNLNLYIEYSHRHDKVFYPKGDDRLDVGVHGKFGSTKW